MKNNKISIILFNLILSSTLIFGQDLEANFSYFSKSEYNAKIVSNSIDDKGFRYQKAVID